VERAHQKNVHNMIVPPSGVLTLNLIWRKIKNPKVKASGRLFVPALFKVKLTVATLDAGTSTTVEVRT
jgi:hypothetical protein